MDGLFFVWDIHKNGPGHPIIWLWEILKSTKRRCSILTYAGTAFDVELEQMRLENFKMARAKKTDPAESPVAAAVEAVEAVKEKVTAKKAAAAKKAPAKTAKKAEKVEEIYLQAGGTEWNVSECKERAIAAFKDKGHRASSVKKLVIYLKPEEGKAYYVINDDESGSFEL